MKLQPEHCQVAETPEPMALRNTISTGKIAHGCRIIWTDPTGGLTITIDSQQMPQHYQNKQLALDMIARAIAELPEPSE